MSEVGAVGSERERGEAESSQGTEHCRLVGSQLHRPGRPTTRVGGGVALRQRTSKRGVIRAMDLPPERGQI